MSTRKQSRLEAKNFIDTLSVTPYPNSQKTYIQGSRSDLRVPMREIALADSLIGGSQDSPVYVPNEPIHVYDTSGVYTDPNHHIDLYSGLPKLREQWIDERADTEVLAGVSSEFAKQRLEDETLDELRYGQLPRIRRGVKGACVTQLHYARKGIVTLKWNTSRYARIWDVKNSMMKCSPSSIRVSTLVLTYPKRLRQSSFAKRSLKGALSFLPILTTLSQSP